jgi:hypothetical protein
MMPLETHTVIDRKQIAHNSRANVSFMREFTHLQVLDISGVGAEVRGALPPGWQGAARFRA